MPSVRPKVIVAPHCFLEVEPGRYLLIQRASDDEHNPGLWEGPGGKLEEGETLEEALANEICQEVGHQAEPVWPFWHSISQMSTKAKYLGHLYIGLFTIWRVVSGKFRLSREHQAFAVVTYAQMLTYNLTREYRQAAIALRKYLDPILSKE